MLHDCQYLPYTSKSIAVSVGFVPGQECLSGELGKTQCSKKVVESKFPVVVLIARCCMILVKVLLLALVLFQRSWKLGKTVL